MPNQGPFDFFGSRGLPPPGTAGNPDGCRVERLDRPTALDCRDCAACCRDATDGRVLVGAADLVRWRREGRRDILESLVPGHFSRKAFAERSDGACAHLGTEDRPNDCAIYETRGESCRAVEPGSRACLEYRAIFLQPGSRRD